MTGAPVTAVGREHYEPLFRESYCDLGDPSCGVTQPVDHPHPRDLKTPIFIRELYKMGVRTLQGVEGKMNRTEACTELFNSSS